MATARFVRRSAALLLVLSPLALSAQQPAAPQSPERFRLSDPVRINTDTLRGGARPEPLPIAGPLQGELPRARTAAERRRLAERAQEASVVVTATGGARAGRSLIIPTIKSGAAVWVRAAPDKPPRLVTTTAWLGPSDAFRLSAPPALARSALEPSSSARPKTSSWAATIEERDDHRGLALLRTKMPPPARPLALWRAGPEASALPFLIGVQILLGAIYDASIGAAGQDELAFFLATSAPIGAGSPLLTPDGALLGLGAVPHPLEPQKTLLVGPQNLGAFLASVAPERDAR